MHRKMSKNVEKCWIQASQRLMDEKNAGISCRRASNDFIEKPDIENIEIGIFLERISYLFAEVTKKLEIAAAILPNVRENQKLFDILTEAEMKTVLEAFNYQNDDKSRDFDGKDSAISKERLGDSEESSNDAFSTCDSIIQRSTIIYEALEILNRYSDVREIVESTIKQISPQSHLFLQHFKYFTEHCFVRIRSTPLREKLREKHFRKLWQENHQAQRNIAVLVRFLEDQRSTHRDLMKAIESQYEKYCRTVERLKKKCVSDVKTTINRLENKQITEKKGSEIRENDLKQYLTIAKKKLENLKETNLKLEQQLYSKRFKLSSQLSGIIGKFDAEMKENRQVLEQLEKEYEEDKAKKEELQRKMKIQLVEYQDLKTEQEKMNLSVFQEELNKIMKKRAIKLIQNWWRSVHERLKREKKRKTNKKIKKK